MSKELQDAVRKAMEGMGLNTAPTPLAKFNLECMRTWHTELKHCVPSDADEDDVRCWVIAEWTKAAPGSYSVYLGYGVKLGGGEEPRGVYLVPGDAMFGTRGLLLGRIEKS